MEREYHDLNLRLLSLSYHNHMLSGFYFNIYYPAISAKHLLVFYQVQV